MKLLALDIGTTSVKGVLFDRNGAILAQSLREYELLKPAPDWVELDCEGYWQAVVAVIAQILNTAGIRPDTIAAVSVTSQGETLILLDQQGRPLRRAIVWLDNRSQAEADAIGRAFPRATVYRITGQQEIIPSWTATRILWLKKHEPELLAQTRKFLLVEDFIIFKLTGRLVTDRALNPSTLYYDILRHDWWPEMLDFLGIRREQLPELLDSGSIVGRLTAEAAAGTGLNCGAVVTGRIFTVAGSRPARAQACATRPRMTPRRSSKVSVIPRPPEKWIGLKHSIKAPAMASADHAPQNPRLS